GVALKILTSFERNALRMAQRPFGFLQHALRGILPSAASPLRWKCPCCQLNNKFGLLSDRPVETKGAYVPTVFQSRLYGNINNHKVACSVLYSYCRDT